MRRESDLLLRTHDAMNSLKGAFASVASRHPLTV